MRRLVTEYEQKGVLEAAPTGGSQGLNWHDPRGLQLGKTLFGVREDVVDGATTMIR